MTRTLETLRSISRVWNRRYDFHITVSATPLATYLVCYTRLIGCASSVYVLHVGSSWLPHPNYNLPLWRSLIQLYFEFKNQPLYHVYERIQQQHTVSFRRLSGFENSLNVFNLKIIFRKIILKTHFGTTTTAMSHRRSEFYTRNCILCPEKTICIQFITVTSERKRQSSIYFEQNVENVH